MWAVRFILLMCALAIGSDAIVVRLKKNKSKSTVAKSTVKTAVDVEVTEHVDSAWCSANCVGKLRPTNDRVAPNSRKTVAMLSMTAKEQQLKAAIVCHDKDQLKQSDKVSKADRTCAKHCEPKVLVSPGSKMTAEESEAWESYHSMGLYRDEDDMHAHESAQTDSEVVSETHEASHLTDDVKQVDDAKQTFLLSMISNCTQAVYEPHAAGASTPDEVGPVAAAAEVEEKQDEVKELSLGADDELSARIKRGEYSEKEVDGENLSGPATQFTIVDDSDSADVKADQRNVAAAVAFLQAKCPEAQPCACQCDCEPIMYGTPAPLPPTGFATAEPPKMSMLQFQANEERHLQARDVLMGHSGANANSSLAKLRLNRVRQIEQQPAPVQLGPVPWPLPPPPPPPDRSQCPEMGACNCFCPCRAF